MTKELKSVLNTKNGYVIIPRQLAKGIIDHVNIEDAAKLYYYLLLSANYAKTENKYGVLQRGETDKSLRQIAVETHSSYEHLRYLVKELKDGGLLEFQQIGVHRRIILPYYEEHCGRRVRTVEQAGEDSPARNQTDIDFDYFWAFYHHIIPDVPETDYEEARKAFARLSLKDRRAAAENVPAYFDRLNNTKHAKWAAHYLKERCFILPKEKN